MANQIKQVCGRAVAVRGNDIDTDRIIPARYLREITFARMGEYAFRDERFDPNGNPKPHPFNDPRYKGASILVVNANFGCGSSREHAPQALMRWGIRAIVGESFADIFAGNCHMIGVPTALLAKDEIATLMDWVEKRPDQPVTIDLEKKEIVFGHTTLPLKVNESSREAFITGLWDTTALMAEAMEEIRATAARLPYITNFA